MTSPDSVLVSLRRLKEIEEQRVREEQEEARRRREAQREAVEAEALLPRRETEERVRLEAAEAAERERRREAERAREERLQVAEAQARARVEAELQLERERLGREIEARQTLRHSVLERAIPIGLCLLLALGAALSFVAWRREGANASQLAARLDEARLREAEAARRVQGLEGNVAAEQLRVGELSRRLASCQATPTLARPEPPTRLPPKPGPRPHRPPPTIDTSCAKDPIGCIAPGR